MATVSYRCNCTSPPCCPGPAGAGPAGFTGGDDTSRSDRERPAMTDASGGLIRLSGARGKGYICAPREQISDLTSSWQGAVNWCLKHQTGIVALPCFHSWQLMKCWNNVEGDDWASYAQAFLYHEDSPNSYLLPSVVVRSALLRLCPAPRWRARGPTGMPQMLAAKGRCSLSHLGGILKILKIRCTCDEADVLLCAYSVATDEMHGWQCC